jgi:hypothetical protein
MFPMKCAVLFHQTRLKVPTDQRDSHYNPQNGWSSQMKDIFALSLFGLFLFMSAPLSIAQGTYMQIDVPGSIDTALRGINSEGDISGFYVDDSLGNDHGFLLSGGSYMTIDYPDPNFPDTQLFGMNDVGQTVGVAFGNGLDVGFVYSTATQTFTEISYPGSLTTFPENINNAGKIVGLFYSQNNRTTFGFEFDGSTYTKIGAPKGFSTEAFGITTLGDIVGVAYGPGLFNFMLHQGKYEFLELPNAPRALVAGINNAGTTLVGSYAPVSGGTAGFLGGKQVFVELQFPGSNQTTPYGINNAGEVVGFFSEPSLSTYHGFTWTPSVNKK